MRAEDLIHALSRLAQDHSGDAGERTTQMPDLLLDGLFVQR
ncbi:MAG: hypothetical protein ACTH2E_04160 [Microbacterium sp.]